MLSTKNLFALISASAVANAFSFDVEPTCVPMDSLFDFSDSHLEILLGSLCKFDADAEYDPGFDCTDLPEACKDSLKKKAFWAISKRYVESQGTDRPGCDQSVHSRLTRDVEFP